MSVCRVEVAEVDYSNDPEHIVPVNTVAGIISISVTLSITGHQTFEMVAESAEWKKAVEFTVQPWIIVKIQRGSHRDWAAFIVQKTVYQQNTVTVSGTDPYYQLDNLLPVKRVTDSANSLQFGATPNVNHIRFGYRSHALASTVINNVMQKIYVTGHTLSPELHDWLFSPFDDDVYGAIFKNASIHDYEAVAAFPKLWNVLSANGMGVLQAPYVQEGSWYEPHLYVISGTVSTYPVTSATAFKGSQATRDTSTTVDYVYVLGYRDDGTGFTCRKVGARSNKVGTIIESIPSDITTDSDVASYLDAKGLDYLYSHRDLTSYSITVPGTAYMGIPNPRDDKEKDRSKVFSIYLGSWVDVETPIDTVHAQVVQSVETFKAGVSTVELTVGTVRPSNIALYNLR